MSHTDICKIGKYTVRRLHSPDGKKSFGVLAGEIDAGGNMIDPKRYITEHTAIVVCTLLDTRSRSLIDKINGISIAKFTTRIGTVNYATFIAPFNVETDFSIHSTLKAAREFCGERMDA